MDPKTPLPYDMKVEIIRPDQLMQVVHTEAAQGWVLSGGLSDGAVQLYEKVEGMWMLTFLRVNPEKVVKE